MRITKASESEPLMKCRKPYDGIKTGAGAWLRNEPGGSLLIGQAVPGMKAARAWFRLPCGTWERVAPTLRWAGGGLPGTGELQADDTVRSRVPTRGALADSPVVAVIRLRIAVGWGAKGRGCPGE